MLGAEAAAEWPGSVAKSGTLVLGVPLMIRLVFFLIAAVRRLRNTSSI